MVDDKFLSKLPSDPMFALRHVVDYCEITVKEMGGTEMGGKNLENLETELIQLLALFKTLSNKYSLPVNVELPQITEGPKQNVASLRQYFANANRELGKISAQNLLNASLARFERELDVGFHYEFSEGEIARLQALVNELRESIRDANFLDEDHRRRLLGRLEKLQAELHKRVPDLDRHLGTMVQIAAALGQSGEEAKPLFDRVREFTGIVAGVFRRAESLEPGQEFPLLPKWDDSGE